TNLRLGMYVCALDRSWLDTPFPFQGLWIKSLRNIERLRLYSDHVTIDPNKSWIRVNGEDPLRDIVSPTTDKGKKKNKRVSESVSETGYDNRNTESIHAEIRNAKKIYCESAELISGVLEDIKKGKQFDFAGVCATSVEMVGSILRNSDALLWLTQLRNKDDYAYQHALNVSILMIAMGKHMMLPNNQLNILGIAGLMQDIGLLFLPDAAMRHRHDLIPEHQAIIKGHVDKSIEVLKQQAGITPLILKTVAEHHERFDGSGYPKGLLGTQISLLGSIAGICDAYDSMVSERQDASSLSPFQALMRLYEIKGRQFNNALVERLIQCIGIYPIGCLLEMNTGEIGIVIEQRKNHRLKPMLMILLDPNKQTYPSPFVLDLIEEPCNDDGVRYEVKDVLKANEFGIDPTEYYLSDSN
ncbi:MAG: HD domain-containing phosphohydrolase, partial [Pseudomonadota bacterium]